MGERNHFIYPYQGGKGREKGGEKEGERASFLQIPANEPARVVLLIQQRFRDIIMKRGGRNNATRKHLQTARECVTGLKMSM